MTNNIRVLIVDDEFQCRSLICKLIGTAFPGFIVEQADNITDTLHLVSEFKPDLIFLDVQMKGETGFDLLDHYPGIDAAIIFTTAHSEFAVKAFRYSAMDYLMKPLEMEDFRMAVDKAVLKIKSLKALPGGQIDYFNQLRNSKAPPDKLTVPTAEGYLFIKIEDIIYCHASGNYTEFHLANGQTVISSYTLGYYNDLLEDHNFFRVHRSYLINLSFIKMYKKGDGGVVIMNNGDEIEVSRNNKNEFLKFLKL
jgi:two-component system LytT family response regulator